MVRSVIVVYCLVLDFIIGGINMLPFFAAAAAAAAAAWEGFAAGVSLGVSVYQAVKSDD